MEGVEGVEGSERRTSGGGAQGWPTPREHAQCVGEWASPGLRKGGVGLRVLARGFLRAETLRPADLAGTRRRAEIPEPLELLERLRPSTK